jgi:cell division protein FtsW
MFRKKSQKEKVNKSSASKAKRRIHLGRGMDNMLGTFVLRYDASICILVAMLIVFGVVMVFSAGYYTTTNNFNDPYYYLRKQIGWVVIGIGAMVFCAKFDYHRYQKWYLWFAIISIVLLALLFTPLGVNVNYATRWFQIGPIRVTPSELSKLAMIIFTSGFLAERPGRVRSAWILVLGFVMAVHLVLIIKQPNLSTALVICAIMIGIMFVAGMWSGFVIVAVVALLVGLIVILLFFPNSHWFARLTTFVNPFKDAQGDGYQVSQSLIALGNGGLTGRGLGNSVAKNLYLPEPQNDFILAIIGEELGFIGIALLMAVYLILIYRCFVITGKAKDKLGFFLASGVTIMLSLQVLMNVAVVTASMPATGVTLPFISYGGTSLVVFMAAMGIMLNISKESKRKL